MVLNQLKGRLKTARRGHKLLKDKRDELMRQFMDVVKLNKQLRTRVEEGLTGAFASLQVASSIIVLDEMLRCTRELQFLWHTTVILQCFDQLLFGWLLLEFNKYSCCMSV